MEAIINSFDRINALAEVDINKNFDSPRITVDEKKGKEYFHVTLTGNTKCHVTNIDKAKRHLILHFNEENKIKTNFLCGFDERHLFVAEVDTSTNVESAFYSLLPTELVNNLSSKPIKKKSIVKRHNKNYKRQGEFFFIPLDTTVNEEFPIVILKNEAIRRERLSKPHTLEFCIRDGTTVTYFHPDYPNGITEKEYNVLSNNIKSSRKWKAEFMTSTLLAKGKVSHADHKTLKLLNWHKVLINGEVSSLKKEVRINQFID